VAKGKSHPGEDHRRLLTWRQAERLFTRPPTVREILEAFSEEARELAPRRLAQTERTLRTYYRKYIFPAVRKARREDKPVVELLVTALWPNCEVITELSKRIKHLQRVVAELKRREGTKGEGLSQDAIEKAREYPLEDLCSHYGIMLQHVGRLLRGCCPFHEDHKPSFTIYPDNRWYCFGCHQGGDSTELLRRMENLAFSEAVRRLAT